MIHIFVQPRFPNKRIFPYRIDVSCQRCADWIVQRLEKTGYTVWVGDIF
jgi:hypothetical protein